MLDRSAEIVDELVAAEQANPVADPLRTGLSIWSGLHGIVTLRIDKDAFPWPDAHELAHQMPIALVRPA